MSIPVRCLGCSKSFTAPDSAAGRRGKCPSCGASVRVPEPVSIDASSGGFADDLADAIAVDHEPSPTPMSDLYETPTPPRHSVKTPPTTTRPGPHRVARRTAIVVDWIWFWMTVLVSVVVGIAYAAICFGHPEVSAMPVWVKIVAFVVLTSAVTAIFWTIYLVERVFNSALIAIFDIEDHLARMSGRR